MKKEILIIGINENNHFEIKINRTIDDDEISMALNFLDRFLIAAKSEDDTEMDKLFR